MMLLAPLHRRHSCTRRDWVRTHDADIVGEQAGCRSSSVSARSARE